MLAEKTCMRIYCPTCWRDYPDTERSCRACGTSLWDFGSDDFVAKLIRSLHHPQPVTVERAATLLGRIRDQRAAEPLLALLGEEAAPEALVAAADSLAMLGERRAIPLLVRLRAAPTSFLIVRLAVVRALARLGGLEAESALQQALDDRSPAVRDLAAEALAQLAATGVIAREEER